MILARWTPHNSGGHITHIMWRATEYAVIPLVRIRAAGARELASLPRRGPSGATCPPILSQRLRERLRTLLPGGLRFPIYGPDKLVLYAGRERRLHEHQHESERSVRRREPGQPEIPGVCPQGGAGRSAECRPSASYRRRGGGGSRAGPLQIHGRRGFDARQPEGGDRGRDLRVHHHVSPMLAEAESEGHRARFMFGYAMKAEAVHAELYKRAL